MGKHAVKLNYKNIFLFAAIVVLVVVILILIIALSSKKEPEPTQSSSSAVVSSVVSDISVTEDSSSGEEASSASSDTASRSSSSGTSSGSGKIVTIPSTPYNYDTTGKTVRNAFDSNGEIDLLFPINTTYYVTKNFEVISKISVDSEHVMDHRAAPHLKEMLAAMKNDISGTTIRAFSTYRSFSYQQSNFNRKKKKYLDKGYSEEEAYAKAATSVAIPGTSEHQLGLAVDVYLDSLYNKYGELNEHFEETEEFEWLQKHAAEYGFILSFPKDKVANTGIIYEPWHYRYVGVENAKKIKASGMTLAEWLDSQNIVYVYNGK